MSEARNNTTAGFALYDRWMDAKMNKSEFVGVYTARSLAVAAWLAAQSSANVSQQWGIQLTGDSQITAGTIEFQNGNPALGTPATAQLTSSHNLTDARIVWEVSGAQPQIGSTFSFERSTVGESRIEAEATLSDGRRVFGTTTVYVNDPQNGGQPYTLDSGTVALYHFDGNFNDSQTPNPHNLTVQSGGVTFSDNTTWMQTPSGKVAGFAGIKNRLTATIPYNVLRPAGSDGFTIEFWVYVKSVPNTTALLYLLRLSQTEGSGDVNEWSVKYHSSDAPFPQVYGPAGQVVLASDGVAGGKDWEHLMTPNTWHLIKITAADDPGASCQSGWTGFDTKVYIDDMNTAAASATTCAYLDPNSPWILSMGDFDGYIDELRISNITR